MGILTQSGKFVKRPRSVVLGSRGQWAAKARGPWADWDDAARAGEIALTASGRAVGASSEDSEEEDPFFFSIEPRQIGGDDK